MSQRLFLYIILVLAGIGLIVTARQWIIPISVFGAIFLLWKFPPDRWGRSFRNRTKKQNHNYRSEQRRKGARTVEGKFRVIDGGRDDQDDPPRYH